MTAICIDTSALVAIRRSEPGHLRFKASLATPEPLIVPASAILEFAIVSRHDVGARQWLDQFLDLHLITTAPIDAETARLAADAFALFGRGTGHPAALNFGGCLSYAVAKQQSAALLFKGDDFRHTDVKVAP